jgi:hypothetical protein
VEPVQIVFHVADSGVASSAQNPSNFPGVMVMVYMRPKDSIPFDKLSPTYGADVVLIGYEVHEILWTKPVSILDAV